MTIKKEKEEMPASFGVFSAAFEGLRGDTIESSGLPWALETAPTA